MNNKFYDISEKQTRLFLSFQYARLSIDLNIVTKELDENRATAICGNESFFEQAKVRVQNTIRGFSTDNLLKKKEVIERQLKDFAQKHNCSDLAHSYAELSSMVNELYGNDTYGIAKIIFSTSLIFDVEYEYQYNDKGLKNLSRVLWNNETIICNMESEIKNIYTDLARQPLSLKQKAFIGFVVVSAILCLPEVNLPSGLSLGAASASDMTSSLKAFGGSMLDGLSKIATSAADRALFVDLASNIFATGVAYGITKGYNELNARKTFRSANWQDVTHILAIKCYMLVVTKRVMPENVYKESVCDFLHMIRDLKLDIDYALFVEKQDIENNKNKLNVFHNLDKKLTAILTT